MESIQKHLTDRVRIYYSSPKIVIINNPYNKNEPTLVVRNGEPDWKDIDRVLKLCNMKLTGEGYFREDGLFCHPVKEVNDGY